MDAPRADMHFAPSYPPISPSSPDCSSDHTLKVQVFVLVGVVGMLLLHVLGSLRRLSSHSLLHGIVMGVHTLSYPLVSYTIGWMQSSDCFYYDFAVWAVCLLLLLGSTDSLTVCRLKDIDDWKGIYVKHFFKGFMVVFVILGIVLEDLLDKEHDMSYLWWPVFPILFVGILKSYVRIASMRMVSKSYLFKNMKVVDEYMKDENRQLVPLDPVTMKGCMYMVAGEKYCIKQAWDKVTTVEQIWQYKGNLLLQERGKMLKDICLSMALSKMLNRRFAGFKLSDVEHEKSSVLVFQGLLGGDKPHQRAFRVIEEELIFVHDLYYTRYSYLQQKGRYLALYLPVIMFGLCSWLTYVLVKHRHTGHNLGSTIFITVVLAFLEAYQLYLYIASGWFKVALIRSYVSTPFLRSFRFLEMIISLLLRLNAFHPWEDTLGQYCLLRKHGRKSLFRNCLHYATLRLVDKAKKRRRKSLVKLSQDVKEAIVHSLVQAQRNGQLISGVTSPLNNNGVHDLPSWSWVSDATATDGGVTRTIVVWHIATTLCWQQLDAQATKEDAAMARIASTLSKYCMYLVAFAPNLLPDNIFVSESILDKAIDEADKLLKKHQKLDKRCRILMQMEYSISDDASLLTQGAELARCLMSDKHEPALRWKYLSDFWAGMMLYVSPSDDAQAHLEVLARGGEFITHIWALLTHAGVLNRGHTTGPNRV